MKVCQTFYYTGGAFITFQDDAERLTAFMTHGKDEVRRIILTHAYDDEDLPRYLRTVDEIELPEIAVAPSVRYDGGFLNDLCALITVGYGTTGADVQEVITYHPNRLHLLYLPNTPEGDSGTLHHCDAAMEHHVVVLYSKEQVLAELAAMRWLPADVRPGLTAAVRDCTLPETSEAAPIRIAGRFAAILNGIVEKHDLPDEVAGTARAN